MLDLCLSRVAIVDVEVGASPDAGKEIGRALQLQGGEFDIAARLSSPAYAGGLVLALGVGVAEPGLIDSSRRDNDQLPSGGCLRLDLRVTFGGGNRCGKSPALYCAGGCGLFGGIEVAGDG